jgi:hypothetical protein
LQFYANQYPEFRGFDVFTFEYETRIWQQPFDPIHLDRLRAFFRSVKQKYTTAVVIAHSQGGVLAKLFLIRELKAQRGADLIVDLIMTLGTPHRGLKRVLPLWLGHRIPGLRKVIPYRQLADLCVFSRNIRWLKKDWGHPLIRSSPAGGPQPASRFIRSLAFAARRDVWARKRSAKGFRVDVPTTVDGVHTSIPKLPISVNPRTGGVINNISPVMVQILDELRTHQYPTDVLKQIGVISGSPIERQRYHDAHSLAIFEQVRLARPNSNKKELHRLTHFLRDEFPIRFPKQPLRGLDFSGCLRMFVDRSL